MIAVLVMEPSAIPLKSSSILLPHHAIILVSTLFDFCIFQQMLSKCLYKYCLDVRVTSILGYQLSVSYCLFSDVEQIKLCHQNVLQIGLSVGIPVTFLLTAIISSLLTLLVTYQCLTRGFWYLRTKKWDMRKRK